MLGSLAAIASAAVPTALILSRTGPSRAAGPVIITRGRTFTEDSVVNTVVFNPHDGTLASGTDKGTVQLRDGTTGRKVGILRVDPPVSSIAFRPDGQTLAIGGGTDSHPMVRLWDITSGQVTILRGQEKRVSSVAFSRDGRYLASGSPWDLVKVWDVASRRFSGFSAYTPVYSVAFNRDGTALALGGGHHRDGKAQLRTLPGGTEFDVIPGDAGLVGSVAFSRDGSTLASGSTDKTVRLWDVTTGTTIAIFRGHRGWVESVAFSPDGKTLASGGDDSTVRIWRIP